MLYSHMLSYPDETPHITNHYYYMCGMIKNDRKTSSVHSFQSILPTTREMSLRRKNRGSRNYATAKRKYFGLSAKNKPYKFSGVLFGITSFVKSPLRFT